MDRVNTYHRRTLSKIIPDLADAAQVVRRMLPRRVVLVKGVYDLLHVGHYLSFVGARMLGDVLIVGVNSDEAVKSRKGEDRPIISESDRLLQIAAIECVDFVTLYQEASPYNLIRTIEPAVFASSHFDFLSNGERIALEEKVSFAVLPKSTSLSTSDIIQRIRSRTE